MDLAGAELELAEAQGRAKRIENALKTAETENLFDFRKHLHGQIKSSVKHRYQNALNIKLRIVDFFDLLNRVRQL